MVELTEFSTNDLTGKGGEGGEKCGTVERLVCGNAWLDGGTSGKNGLHGRVGGDFGGLEVEGRSSLKSS